MTTLYDIPNEGVPIWSDVAVTDDDSIIHDMALEEVVVNEPIKMGEWEEWTPMFYPVYEEPSFPLPELSTETILCLWDKMNPKVQARFLLSINSIAQRPDIKAKLFHLKREHVYVLNCSENGHTTYAGSNLARSPERCLTEKTELVVHTGTVLSSTGIRELKGCPLMI